MYRIPPKGSAARQRLIDEHKRCTESMYGVPGFSSIYCETQGDTTKVTGGIHEDIELRQVLLRMHAQEVPGKLVAICTKIDEEWRIARLSGIRGVPPEFVDDRVFHTENEIQHEIFLMRLDEMSETDGQAEDYHPGWKRRDDNWTVT